MKLTMRELQALKHCVTHRLLDEIPEIIKWRGDYVRVWIPASKLRRQEEFDAWKEALKDSLPQWVLEIKDPYFFYQKIILLNTIVCELDISQTLPLFVKGYRDGLNGAKIEIPPAPIPESLLVVSEPQAPPSPKNANSTPEQNPFDANDAQSAADDLTAALGL